MGIKLTQDVHTGCASGNALVDPRQTVCEIWQIFGKMGFNDNSRYEGKVRMAAYLLVMVGLGGLEPPTSPLSGALWCYMHSSLACGLRFSHYLQSPQRGPAQPFSLFLHSFSKQLAMISSLRRAYPLPEILTIRSGNLK